MMRMSMSAWLSVASLSLCAAARADLVWPRTVGEMEHVMVSLDAATHVIHVHVADVSLPLRNFGESHFPPADVLDGKGYNDQYGWVADGMIQLDPGQAIWIALLTQTPGLETYEGGMRMMKEHHTYAPIHATAGSPAEWRWDGTMMHNWYAAAAPGSYEATYRVYVGDESGVPLDGFMAGEVTLHWNYVPEPSSTALMLFSAAAALARRR